ncbi:MAG: helix-turn-helix domain-containing protein [Bacillota bacterium]
MLTEKGIIVNQELTETSNILQDGRRKNWFWDYNDIFGSNLSANAMLVRLYLARCANGDRQAWPSLNTIARNCKISKPTVIKALRELEEKGWLKKIIRQRPSQEYETTVYVLLDAPTPNPSQDTEGGNGGSKTDLPPVKNITSAPGEGVVKNCRGVVNEVYHVVKQVDLNNTHRTILKDLDQEDLLFASSLRSEANNGAAANAAAAVSRSGSKTAAANAEKVNKKARCKINQSAAQPVTQQPANNSPVTTVADNTANQSDSRPQAGVADKTVVANAPVVDNTDQQPAINPDSRSETAGGSGTAGDTAIKPPTNKELIAELTREYRSIEGITPAKGDYAFIGALYNLYGYDQVLEAIYELRLAMSIQEIRKPLLYLKAVTRALAERSTNVGCNNGGSLPKTSPGRSLENNISQWHTPEEKRRRKELIESLYMDCHPDTLKLLAE